MKIVDCIQGSPEWFSARCGIPSASNFDQIITTKNESSKQRTKYLYRLAGERVSGIAEETYQNNAMLRGIELEAEARNLYQVIKDIEVKQFGFCLTEGKFVVGASPDGLVDDKGCIEIKCPTMAVHVGYLLENKLPIDYFQQTQGQLFVTEREWVDFVSYYPGIKPLIVRVERDEQFIKALELELEKFCVELEEIVNKIK